MKIEIDLNGSTERPEYIFLSPTDDDPEKVWINLKGYDNPTNVSWVTLDKGDLRRVAKALMLLGDE